MATRTDRYAPLKDRAAEAPEKAQEPSQSHEDGKTAGVEQDVAARHAERQAGANVHEDGPTRPTDMPWRSPGWTDRGGLVEQQTSAMDWLKASHEWRQSAQKQAGLDEPATQDTERSRPLSFYEDRQPGGQSYDKLKVEHAEAAGKDQAAERGNAKEGEQSRRLSFFEDRQSEARNYDALKREHAQESGQQAEKQEGRDQGDGPSFFEDHNPDPGRSR